MTVIIFSAHCLSISQITILQSVRAIFQYPISELLHSVHAALVNILSDCLLNSGHINIANVLIDYITFNACHLSISYNDCITFFNLIQSFF